MIRPKRETEGTLVEQPAESAGRPTSYFVKHVAVPIRRDREDPTTSTKRLVDQNPLLSMMPDVPPKLPVAYGPYGRDTQSLTRVDFPVSTLYMFLGRLERSLCWHKSQVVFLSGLFSRLGLARGCASAICNVPSHKWAGLLAGLYVAWPSTAPVLNDIAVPHGQRDVLKTESKFVSGAMCCHKDTLACNL